MSEKTFSIARIFVKDSSIEMPQGAAIFTNPESPSLNLNLAIESILLEENVYETSIRGTLRAELQGKVAYLVEIQQAGIFQIAGYEEAELQQILNVSVPHILYPYLRSNIAQQLTNMTVPVFYLPELTITATPQEASTTEAANS